MAAPGLLPTKYVNGVPLPTSRKTLRMREKYIILLVFVTFGTVCFGAFVYLPDFRDGVRVDTLRGHLQNVGDVMVPHRGVGGKILRHDNLGIDAHVIDDKLRLGHKIEFDIAQQKRMEEVGKKLNMSKGDTLKFKQHIEDDKEKIVQEKKNKEELIKQFEMEKLKVVKQDHAGGEGAQGGAPTDHDVLEKRNQVKEVYHYINYTCTLQVSCNIQVFVISIHHGQHLITGARCIRKKQAI